MIYLDNAATTQIDPRVLEAMMPYLTEQYGNPGGIYKLGRDAKDAVENARCQVAKFLNAEPGQIYFTSGATEGNNMVFEMCAQYMLKNDKKDLLASATEHDSVIKSVVKLCSQYDFRPATLYPNNLGKISVAEVREQLVRSKAPGLVSVMAMNNEVASANAIDEIAKVCHEHGAFFHTDCVQAAGQRMLNVREIGCDFATISSHKIHGPKGVGAVYIKDSLLFEPWIVGGDMQEFGMRGGTENVAGIVGFGKACELVNMDDAVAVRNLKYEFWRVFCAEIERLGLSDDMWINGTFGIGKLINFGVTGVDAETLLLLLDSKGICVSAGSACNSRLSVPSHVLKAMGRTDEQARSSIRVSFSRMNTVEEVREAAHIIADSIAFLRNMSTDGKAEI